MVLRAFLFAVVSMVTLTVASCRTTSENTSSGVADLGVYQEYTVFVWPKGASVIPRDYDALGIQMTQYAQYVGHSLYGESRGLSERTWWESGDRDRRKAEVRSAAAGGVGAYCEAVARCFVDEKLPVGEGDDRSEFCQYGNCGEGGQVGACLALTYGFRPFDEIRHCYSENDHAFAMVRRESHGDWCLLDRWSMIGNFRCGIQWDETTLGVTVDGVRNSEEWFQRVQCRSLSGYVRDLAR